MRGWAGRGSQPTAPRAQGWQTESDLYTGGDFDHDTDAAHVPATDAELSPSGEGQRFIGIGTIPSACKKPAGELYSRFDHEACPSPVALKSGRYQLKERPQDPANVALKYQVRRINKTFAESIARRDE
jgi:hypothetical protein